MNEQYEYSTMRELGKRFGVSSHAIGKWLKECGLRTVNGKPSRLAFEGGYVTQAPTPTSPDGYFYVWHTAKTIKALEAAGHKLVTKETPTLAAPRLTGPFKARKNGEITYEIVDSNGSVGVWAAGEENAVPLVKLLNLASDNDVFF